MSSRQSETITDITLYRGWVTCKREMGRLSDHLGGLAVGEGVVPVLMERPDSAFPRGGESSHRHDQVTSDPFRVLSSFAKTQQIHLIT